jgi:hypothetical protein
VIEGERLALDGARVIEPAENSWVEVRLHEGKHHEVRRLLQALGHPVEKLKRVGLGMLTSTGLDVGEFRSLTPRVVSSFMRGRGNTRSDKFAPLPAPFRPRKGPRPEAGAAAPAPSPSRSAPAPRAAQAPSRRPESAARRQRPR